LRIRLALLAGLALLSACTSRPVPVTGSFGDFTPPAGHVHYLACPVDYCLAKPDETTPLLPVGAERMRELVRHAIDPQPQTILVETGNEGLRLVYQQRIGLLGPTDTVTIDIVDLSETESGIALYSQSSSGGGGGSGANADRVHRWLAAIQAEAQRASAR
jgi:hypothetical protein